MTFAGGGRFQAKRRMNTNLCVIGLIPCGEQSRWPDPFRCHRNKDLLEHVKKRPKTDVVVILVGMTSMLQPLNIGVNHPMKTVEEWIQNWR